MDKNLMFPQIGLHTPTPGEDDEDDAFIQVIETPQSRNKTLIMREMSPEDIITAKKTSCFGELYYEEGVGYCELPCLVKEYCKAVHLLTVTPPGLRPPPVVKYIYDPSIPNIIDIALSKKNVRKSPTGVAPVAGKKTQPYVSKGRQIDDLVKFVEENITSKLDDKVQTLPLNWKKRNFATKYGQGKALVFFSYTNTYFSIYDKKANLILKIYFNGNTRVTIHGMSSLNLTPYAWPKHVPGHHDLGQISMHNWKIYSGYNINSDHIINVLIKEVINYARNQRNQAT